MKDKIKNDLDLISKELYLESPNLWIDFIDRVNEDIFDEFVLYVASKYDYASIIEYVMEGKIFDLNSRSRNSKFKNVYEHLVSTAKTNNSNSVLDLLLNKKASSKEEIKNDIVVNDIVLEDGVETDIEIYHNTTSTEKHKIKTEKDIPSFVCKNCNSNIFENGYVTLENKVFKFSKKSNTVVEVEKTVLDNVVCKSCNSKINITPNELEVLCTVNCCTSCRADLRKVGIITKNKMVYDDGSNSFSVNKTDYTCANCNTFINSKQIKHFSLD